MSMTPAPVIEKTRSVSHQYDTLYFDSVVGEHGLSVGVRSGSLGGPVTEIRFAEDGWAEFIRFAEAVQLAKAELRGQLDLIA